MKGRVVINFEELRELGPKLGPLLLVALLPGGLFLAPFLLMRWLRAARRDT
jgi:hypothetical protein